MTYSGEPSLLPGYHKNVAKSPDAFRTISEVASDLNVPPHVLRFWETKFAQIKPMKRGGGRRYYRPDDVQLLKHIRSLLYVEGYTIKGVQRLLKENGVRTAAQVVNVPDGVQPDRNAERSKIRAPKPVVVSDAAGGSSDKKTTGKQDLSSALNELRAMRAALAPHRSSGA
jgi:DNA-binding transcriptional MerR regulator